MSGERKLVEEVGPIWAAVIIAGTWGGTVVIALVLAGILNYLHCHHLYCS